MGYEEVETVLPADFVPRPDPKPEPVMESLVKEAANVIEQEQVEETNDSSDLLAEVVYPSETESEPEDAACGGMRRGRKKKKRMSLSSSKSKRSLSSSSKKSSTSASTPSSPANSRTGRKSMLSRWRSSRSKSRGRKKKGGSTGGDVSESESETEGKKKSKKGGSRSKSKSKLSFRTIRKVDSNATDVASNTTKKKKKELLEKAKKEAEQKEEEKAAEDELAINTQLSTVREGSPDNTTVTAISNSPGKEKDAGSQSKAPINAPSPSLTMASVSEFSIEVGDENEQVAIAIDSPFNKALVEGGTEKEAAGDAAGAEQTLRTATSGDMSVRSTRSTKSNRSVSSKASARSIKSKKSGESAAGASIKSKKSTESVKSIPDDASVRSTKSNRSVGSTKSTSSKRSVKKSKSKENGDSEALVKASSQEVRKINEESEITAPVSADPSEEENGEETAESSESSQKSKWVKKVSVSIGGYKTSFQFSDPMANLADAVNDALDVVGNGDDNLTQQAKGLDDINATSTEEVDEVGEERDYDENPTRLFMYLQQRAWGLALAQLQSYPEEAKVWVYRKAKPEKAPNVKDAESNALVVQHNSLVVHDGNEQPKFRWKLLPLHAAIVLGAPTEIIQDIVRAYPNAAKKTDERGSLPVHLAASRLDVDPEGEKVVLQLFGAYPDSIEMQDRKGRTPPELAKLARARKDIEEQRKVNMTTSLASQVGQECTMSQHGREPSVASTNASEEDDGDDDDRSVSSGISGRFKQMLFKSKSTDTVDRRKKNKKKKDKKSSGEAELSSAKSMDGGDDEVEPEAPADDAAVADSLGPGFAFLTSSKSQEVRERTVTDEDATEESEAEREPTDAEILKSVKQAICISKEYQTPENAPGEVWDPMNIPLPASFSMGDDDSVRSMRSSRSSRSKRASRSKSSSESPGLAEEEISPTPFPRSGSCDSAKKLTRSGSDDSAKIITQGENSDSAKKLSRSGSTDSAKTPEPPISQEESADSETKKAVTITEEPSEVHETACQTVPDDTEANIEEEVKQPKPVQNEGLRVLLEKAVENAGRSGVDVTEFVQILEDEWVTDVEALRRLDGDTLDDLLPLMLSRELQRLINHADSIDNKFLKDEQQDLSTGGRGRSPKKSSKKKKKKRSYRKAKKRGHFRPVSPPEGPLTPISEEADSPASMNSDDHISIVTEARSVHSNRSAPPELHVPDEDDDDDDDDDGDSPNKEEGDADDDSDEILQSASIEDLEIRKLHANLIADARKKFPTREALEDSITERQCEVEQAVNSGFDVDKQTLARAALADDEVRKLLPLRLILPTVTDLSEMIGVLQVHKEGAMRALNMDKARNIQSEIDELQDQINKEERYLLQKKMDEARVKVSKEKKVVGILRTKEKKSAASEKSTTKDVMTVDSRDDI